MDVTDNQEKELTVIVPDSASSGAIISAQRPVSRRVTAAAKELRAILKDNVFPTLVRMVNDPTTPSKERVKAAEVMLNASLRLEELIARTESARMEMDINLHGKALSAKNIRGNTLDAEQELDNQDDDGYLASLSDNIIDVG